MVRSVDRAIDVLVLVSRSSEPVALPQITRELDLPRTTAFSLVRTLTKRQMLRFVEGRGYRLGPLVGTLAQSTGESKTLIGLVHPVLERISRETAETAFLAVPSGDRIVFLDKVESPHTIRYSAQIGTQRELYCTAHGKLVLACMTEEEFSAYLARTTMQAHSASTIVDPAELRKEIGRIRKRGYSVSNGEYSAEAFGLSAPVFRGLGGPLIGMISAVGPLPRMKPRRQEVAQLLLSIAASLSVECVGVEAPADAIATGAS
jgi:DNA-binding IclR family transcriptional regulator